MNGTPAYRRHDISDKAWKIIEPHLPGRKGTTGRPARCGFLDTEDRSAMAGFTAGLWGLEEYEQTILPVA